MPSRWTVVDVQLERFRETQAPRDRHPNPNRADAENRQKKGLGYGGFRELMHFHDLANLVFSPKQWQCIGQPVHAANENEQGDFISGSSLPLLECGPRNPS